MYIRASPGDDGVDEAADVTGEAGGEPVGDLFVFRMQKKTETELFQ